MENNPAYFEKDLKKGLNWLRNLPWSSSPGYPAITVSRTFPLQSAAEQLVMCEYSVACVNTDRDYRDTCMSLHTCVCLYMYGYTHTCSQAMYIQYTYYML